MINKMLKYREHPAISVMLNPKIIKEMTDKTEPNTDAAQFTPHAQGIIFCPPILMSLIPMGRGIPIKNPKGIKKNIVKIILYGV